MKKILSLLFITFQLATHAHVPAAQAQTSSFRLVGYFTEWSVYGRDFHVADVPADKLTHINYAFAGISNNQIAILDTYAATQKAYPSDVGLPEGALKGNFRQLQLLKQQHPNVKVLISVGGWTGSQNFSSMASSPATRQTFIQSAIAFMEQYGFDGLDLDWEYPVISGAQPGKPEDRANFTALLAEARAALGSQYLLTAAVGASKETIDAIDYVQAQQYVDWISLMSYDYHGAWEAGNGKADHHAALYNDVYSSITMLKAAGVPSSKIVMGLPLYGRSFAGAANGLLSPFTGAGPGTYEPGVLDYKVIMSSYKNKNYYNYFWDEQAQAPYLFSNVHQVFISFDDSRSVGVKAAYARQQGLGGLMAWELSGDNGDLIAAMQTTETAPEPPPAPAPSPTPSPDPTPSPIRSYSRTNALDASPDINTEKSLTVRSGLIQPCVSGSRIKTTQNPAVYYCGADGKRYTFPNERVYATWYSDFSGVVVISSQQLAAIPLGGNVTYRPGVKMVKIQSDPKVYVIEKGGVLRWVTTAQIAASLYGVDWNKKIDDIPDAFFINYSVGEPVED